MNANTATARPAMAVNGVGKRAVRGVMCTDGACETRARRRRRLHAPNVAPIAVLFWKNPTFSPVLLVVLENVGLASPSTTVVTVIMFPSEPVDVDSRVTRGAEVAPVVELVESEIVEISDKVVWEVVDCVEELEEGKKILRVYTFHLWKLRLRRRDQGCRRG